jgi:hypothetical protein
MASLKDVGQVADQLESLVGDLRSELKNGPDFEKLTQIADSISEQADNAAQTFNSINETLMSRIDDIGGKGNRGQKSNSSGAQSREKSATSSSSSSS